MTEPSLTERGKETPTSERPPIAEEMMASAQRVDLTTEPTEANELGADQEELDATASVKTTSVSVEKIQRITNSLLAMMEKMERATQRSEQSTEAIAQMRAELNEELGSRRPQSIQRAESPPRLQRQLFDSPSDPRLVRSQIGTTSVLLPPRSTPSDPRDEEIRALRAEVNGMIAHIHRSQSSAPEIARVLVETQNTPFTKQLTSTPFRPDVKVRCPTFDGKSDPRKFLKAFNLAMGRTRFNPEERDAGYCQLFVENLTDDAMEWFYKLDQFSIGSFQQLAEAFLKHYSVFMQRNASAADLQAIIQGPKESLRSFLGRFREVASRITITDDAGIDMLREALYHDSELITDFRLRRPLSLEDALHRGAVFAEIEEDRAAKLRRHNNRSQTTKESSRETREEQHSEPRQHYDRAYSRQKGKQASTYVVETSDHKQKRPWAPPNKWYRDVSKDKKSYCDYHKRPGHTTAECFRLKELLLEKFENGEVKLGDPEPRSQDSRKDSRKNRNRNEPGKDDEEPPYKRAEYDELLPPPPPRTTVMIMGSIRENVDTVRALKCYEHEAECIRARADKRSTVASITALEMPRAGHSISFSDEDAVNVQFPHDDPVVVKLRVADCDVTRVLIDTGSTVDLIFKKALDKLGIPRADMEFTEVTRPLTGFDGNSMLTLGTVKLPILLAGSTR